MRLQKEPAMKSSFVWFSAVVIFGTALAVRSFEQTPSPEGITATYSHGVLRLTIPNAVAHPGSGQAKIEILDPENRAIASLDSPIAARGSKGEWHEDLRLETPIAAEDLVWHRLRYRFVSGDPEKSAVEGV